MTFVALASLALPESALANSCGVMASLDGTWSGAGETRASPESPQEAVRCRLSFNWDSRGGNLGHSLSCFGTDGSYWSSGTYRVNGGRLDGSFRSSGGGGGASGRCGESTLNLTLTGTDPSTGVDVSATFMISVQGGGSKLVNTIRATDPESRREFQAFEAAFSR